MQTVTIAGALQSARRDIGILEARLLLRHVLQKDAAWLLAHDDARLSQVDQLAYQTLILRRKSGEPIAYLTGEREFYGRRFLVSPATLIPRQDTETLIDALRAQPLLQRSSLRILDLGTGSGILAITLALICPHAQVWAADQSVAALEVARQNARLLGAQVHWEQSDWFSSLTEKRFDLIVSNPPYIAENDPHLLEGDLRFEPIAALVSGPRGLTDLSYIVEKAPDFLTPMGELWLEHGYNQSGMVRQLLVQRGFNHVQSRSDLNGIERVSSGIWPPLHD